MKAFHMLWQQRCCYIYEHTIHLAPASYRSAYKEVLEDAQGHLDAARKEIRLLGTVNQSNYLRSCNVFMDRMYKAMIILSATHEIHSTYFFYNFPFLLYA